MFQWIPRTSGLLLAVLIEPLRFLLPKKHLVIVYVYRSLSDLGFSVGYIEDHIDRSHQRSKRSCSQPAPSLHIFGLLLLLINIYIYCRNLNYIHPILIFNFIISIVLFVFPCINLFGFKKKEKKRTSNQQ